MHGVTSTDLKYMHDTVSVSACYHKSYCMSSNVCFGCAWEDSCCSDIRIHLESCAQFSFAISSDINFAVVTSAISNRIKIMLL